MALTERFDGFNVASALATQATAEPSRVYLQHEGRGYTYAEVDGESDALAASLAGLGVEAGDRVALLLPACPEFAVAMYAVAKLGGVIVPLNPRMPPDEVQYSLRHSEAVCAVTVERAYGVDFLELFESFVVKLPELQYLVTVGEEDLWYDDRIFQFEDLISAGTGRDYPVPDLDPAKDSFAIVYTSGTTGKPKGVELSHRNVVSVAAGTADAIGLGPEDRVVGVDALHHVFGIGAGLVSTMLSGACIVLTDEPEPGEVLDTIPALGATIHYGVPTDFVRELAEQESAPRDLSSLRLAVPAGAPVSDALVHRIREAMGVDVLVAYSLAETSSTVCVSRPADPEVKKATTVGCPLEGTELRILERDGEQLPVESVGEIALKGPGVMLGYHRQPGETAGTIDRDGFFRTGDLGLVDEEGYVHLVGRLKEVIIRAGFNVYPREVESRLEAHPAVREAAVIGVSDPLLGEAVCACIVPDEGAIVTSQELQEWCRSTMAEPKVPDLVRFLDEFPRTGTGKIRRVELSRSMRSEAHTA